MTSICCELIYVALIPLSQVLPAKDDHTKKSFSLSVSEEGEIAKIGTASLIN
jgi:hypothetical protein